MMNWESEICSWVLIWILRWWENVQYAFVVGYSGCPFTFSFSIYIFIMLLPRSPPCQLLPFPFYMCLSCSLNLNRGITSPDMWLQLFYFKFEGLGWTINWPNQYALFGKWISRDLGHTGINQQKIINKIKVKTVTTCESRSYRTTTFL